MIAHVNVYLFISVIYHVVLLTAFDFFNSDKQFVSFIARSKFVLCSHYASMQC